MAQRLLLTIISSPNSGTADDDATQIAQILQQAGPTALEGHPLGRPPIYIHYEAREIGPAASAARQGAAIGSRRGSKVVFRHMVPGGRDPKGALVVRVDVIESIRVRSVVR